MSLSVAILTQFWRGTLWDTLINGPKNHGTSRDKRLIMWIKHGTFWDILRILAGHNIPKPHNPLISMYKKVTQRHTPAIDFLFNSYNALNTGQQCCVPCEKISEAQRAERDTPIPLPKLSGATKPDFQKSGWRVPWTILPRLSLLAPLMFLTPAAAVEQTTWTTDGNIPLTKISPQSAWQKSDTKWHSPRSGSGRTRIITLKLSPKVLENARAHASGNATAAILNLIAVAEVASPGHVTHRDYDAVQHSAHTPPPKQPTSMTIEEVFDWVEKTPGQHHALGRYQIIPDTLRQLVAATGADHSLKFDRVAQDRFATILMEWAGYSRFLAGEMSAVVFMDELAQIWAGLPLQNGKSAYEGYAGNRATVTRNWYAQEFRKIFPDRL